MVRPAQTVPLDGPALWRTWKSVTGVLPVWRVPIDSFTSPSAWGMIGVDYISSLRRNASTQRVADLLDPLAPGDLRRIRALAQVNHRRHEAVSRWVAVGFVTLPLSALLAASQLLPDGTDLFEIRWVRSAAFTLLIMLAAVVYYLAAAWRARQVATVIDLVLIERGLLPDSDAAGDHAVLSLNLE